MVDFLKKKVTDKNSLLECFKVWYEDSILELEDRLIVQLNKDKSFIEKELSEYIHSLDIDNFDILWILLELKFLKIGLLLYHTNLANDVVDTLMNNALEEDILLLESHKEILLDLLDNQGMIYLYTKPIFVGKVENNEYIKNDLTILYKNFIENINKCLEEYDDNISNKGLEELTTYPINMVTKYISKRDMLINQMLTDAPSFFDEVYNVSIGLYSEDTEGLEEAKYEIVDYYAVNFVNNFYKKINKCTKIKLIDSIKENFLYLMENMGEYIK